VGWVEANGSGTEVTDLLELKAIQAVYGSAGRRLALGSVKPNIGHPLAAEGIAAFIKTVLMVSRAGGLPFRAGTRPLRHFDMDAAGLYFPAEPLAWPRTTPFAAINCFADGGTNVHVLVGPPPGAAPHTRPPLPPAVLDRRTVVRGSARPAARPAGPADPTPSVPPTSCVTPADPAAPAALFWDGYR
jgi:polyketide synthase PksJ